MMGDYKFKETTKHDDPKMATIKLKANPKKGQSLAIGQDYVRTKTGYEHKSKTEFVDTACDGQLENKITLTNKDMCYDGLINADALNKDGLRTTIGIQAKQTPGKKETYTDMWARFGGFEAGPFRPEFLFMGHSTDKEGKRTNGGFFATNWLYEKDVNAAFHV
jgi:hypothetical protein